MTGGDDIDQDELAAEWGAGLDDDDAEGANGAATDAGGGDVDQDAMAAAWGAELGDEDGETEGFDEGVAAQWASMMDEASDADTGDSGVERVLNQDEIDNLLGFELDQDALGELSGIRAIVNSGTVSYERLPMLEIVFDRLVRLLNTSLRNFTSDNVEVSFDTISTLRFGDYLNTIPLPAMLAVFRAREWDNLGLMTVDSNLIYAIVDVLLGGRGSPASRVEGRPYTTIESNLVKRMIEVILEDVERAFAPLTSVDFSLDRLETNPRFAAIAREAEAAVMIQLRIDMEDRGGRIEVVLPYATLEPIRELLLQGFMGEKFGQDSIWEEHLANEIWSTEVPVEAVLDELSLPLHRVMNLKAGETIPLTCTPADPVLLRCGDIPLTSGNMGRSGDNIAIKILRPVAAGFKGAGKDCAKSGEFREMPAQ